MNTKMQVYDTRDSGKLLRVNHSSATPSTTSTFSSSQSSKCLGLMAMSTHQAA
ncbi:MAG: hypothetical protein K0Q92_3932 [Steroidobacteraceae bacterium]|nr:hypothetical protein [Steroidobacteraceae bacterium]